MEYKVVNINTVALVANGLQELLPKMVFVGGAVISLYTDDPASDEVRPTSDIDLTIQLAGFSEWTKIQNRLAELRFYPDSQGHAICSYLYKSISVDIMPSENGPFGPSNSWYKPGFADLQKVLVGDQTIRILSPPYFLATKFEAFHTRIDDPRSSYDFEDIIHVLENRMGIVEEIRNADEMIRSFLRDEFRKIINDPYSNEIIGAQIQPSRINEQLPLIMGKISKIIS